MSNKIYVGNLPYKIDENELREIFGQFGEVAEIHLIKDRETRQFKGFGFITFEDSAGAEEALKFDGQKINGRAVKVDRAKERTGGGSGGGRQGQGRPAGNRRW